MVSIIPAILATSRVQFEEDLEKLKSAPGLLGGWIHIDFADDKFVPNRTVEPKDLVGIEIPFKKEAHLMVVDFGRFVDDLKELKFERIIVHSEAVEDLKSALWKMEELGLKIGLAIKLDTSVDSVVPFLEQIDVLLIMSTDPGFQGQLFNSKCLEKIKEAVEIRHRQGFKFQIEVDGGINDQHTRTVIESGVDRLVIGSYLLKGDIDESLEKIWEKVNS